MAENQFFIDSDKLSEAALERKHKLETDPSSRTNHMEYMPGMEQIDPTIRNKVLSEMDSYDYNKYTARDVQNALEHETCSVEDFKALLSPAAEPFLERMAQRAKIETGKHFGNTVYLFTPLYIANYCENYCVYCGFNCYNDIHRKKLTFEEIEHEMKVIADSGIEEILMLTGESRAQSDVEYIGEACRLAKKYFRNIGLEIYPVNSDEYRYLHECGADYVTVFQETYDNVKYETLHLMGHKRVFPYRFEYRRLHRAPAAYRDHHHRAVRAAGRALPGDAGKLCGRHPARHAPDRSRRGGRAGAGIDRCGLPVRMAGGEAYPAAGRRPV